MNNSIKILTTSTLILCFTTSAFADSSFEETKISAIEKVQQAKAILKSIDSNDYATFANLTANTKMSEKINEDNFETLISAYELLKEGEKESAKELFQELEVKPLKKTRNRYKKVHKIKASLEAINSGDYNTWIETIPKNAKITEKINEDNFEDFVYAHELFQNGEKESAKELFQELDVRPLKKHLGKKLDNYINNNED